VGRNKSEENTGQTYDGATGRADPAPRRIDLSNLRDVRLELAAVYRKMDSGQIESQEGTRRAYVLKAIADVITLAELEIRIQELEERQGSALAPRRRTLHRQSERYGCRS